MDTHRNRGNAAGGGGGGGTATTVGGYARIHASRGVDSQPYVHQPTTPYPVLQPARCGGVDTGRTFVQIWLQETGITNENYPGGS